MIEDESDQPTEKLRINSILFNNDKVILKNLLQL